VLLWLILPVCFATTLASGIGTIAASSDLTTADRTKAAATAKDQRAELARLTSEMQGMTARPAGAIAADIEAAKSSRTYRTSQGCTPEQITLTATRAACVKLRALEAELASAKARDDDAAKAAQLRTALKNAPPVSTANPQASAIGTLLNVSAEKASALYALLASLALELAAIASMLTADTPRPAPASKAKGRAVAVVNPQHAERRDVAKFMLDRLPQAKGSEVEISAVYRAFVDWCAGQALQPLDARNFAEAFKSWCECGSVNMRRIRGKVVVRDVTLAG
jgi:hypothetical protein